MPQLSGEETPPFTAVTEKLPPAIPGRAKAIRKAARINTRPPVVDAESAKGRTGHPTVDRAVQPSSVDVVFPQRMWAHISR
jgi:hypothetical protein